MKVSLGWRPVGGGKVVVKVARSCFCFWEEIVVFSLGTGWWREGKEKRVAPGAESVSIADEAGERVMLGKTYQAPHPRQVQSEVHPV